MLKMDQLHKAAGIIRRKSMKGIWMASRLVGYEQAMAMLVVVLRYSILLRLEWWQSISERAMARKVNAKLKQCGLLNIAVYSPSLGRGVVMDENEILLHSIDTEKMYEPWSAKGAQLHLGMWMQELNDTVVIIPAGVYPYREAFDMMLQDHHEFLRNMADGELVENKVAEEDPPLGIGS